MKRNQSRISCYLQIVLVADEHAQNFGKRKKQKKKEKEKKRNKKAKKAIV